MAEQIIKPDVNFIKDVIASGGESVKKCYQCATCSVVCNVTPDDNPFPRKEMLQVQWGLKDKLFGNPDIWLCHQCSDCTAYCPRGAKPGEVLNAVRKLSIKNVAMIPFLSKIAQDPKLLVLLFAIPIMLIIGVMQTVHHHETEALQMGVYHMFIPNGPHMPAPAPMKWLFGLTALFSALSAFVGVGKMWKVMKAQSGGTQSGGNLSGAVVSTITTIMTHSRFADCNVNRLRQWGHMLLLYSFVVLGVSGLLAVVGLPLPVISQVGMIVFLIGLAIIFYNRFAQAGRAGLGSYSDWIFLTIIGGIGVTGLLAVLLRLAGIGAGYMAYAFHLVFVWLLLAFAPYSKFAHLFYRTTAMVFAKASGREKANS